MYLIDTNILIYHFNDDIPEESIQKMDTIFKAHFNISIISKMEFLGFRKHTSNSFIKAKKFIKKSRSFSINDDIVDSVIDIRRENKIKLPDAIIASTALEEELTLVTRNVCDFEDIEELEIYNPFEENQSQNNNNDK